MTREASQTSPRDRAMHMERSAPGVSGDRVLPRLSGRQLWEVDNSLSTQLLKCGLGLVAHLRAFAK